ncbi:hypothetical protein [Nocardia macrotermitis]|uniref:Uncharacterized protein n=1 Tax=Nocardia macrotermitis TaxID=2585198 RepID=A0A7K0CU88_9NOCA|nr:hypothetical protein [Nocardia macrotermitis]MQY17046.1 hypothetical protein [Nocardia macrotermitis]
MSDCEIPGLTPRSAQALIDAGEALAHDVRTRILHSPRPVFLYYIEQTFSALLRGLREGLEPNPDTPAQHLCLHLMISRTQTHGRMVDPDLIRLHRALIADGGHEALVRAGRGGGGGAFDFVALGDALSPTGISAFFAPFEADDMVA